MNSWNKDVLLAENQMLVETQNTALAELRKENEQLKKELSEKDKEIAELKEIKAIKNEKTLKTEIGGVEFTTEQIMVLQRIGISLEEHDKQLRHEICEKIRKFCKENFTICTKFAEEKDRLTASAYNECLYDLRKFLDQIERGDE